MNVEVALTDTPGAHGGRRKTEVMSGFGEGVRRGLAKLFSSLEGRHPLIETLTPARRIMAQDDEADSVLLECHAEPSAVRARSVSASGNPAISPGTVTGRASCVRSAARVSATTGAWGMVTP